MCTSAGGFQVSDPCSCKCHNDEAFSVTDNQCITSGSGKMILIHWGAMKHQKLERNEKMCW